MSTEYIQRLREDLSTMQQVVGTQFPFGRNDIVSMYVIGVLSLIAVVASLVPLEISPRQLRLIYVGVGVIVSLWFLRSYYKGPNRTIAQDREYRKTYYYYGIATGLAVIFVIWILLYGHVTRNIALSIIFFALGTAKILYAATSKFRWPFLGLGIPFVLAGFARVVIPYSVHADNIIIFTTLALGSFGFAGITSYMKRRMYKG